MSPKNRPRKPVCAASRTEVIRLDEGPVSKTGGGPVPLVGSSPTASASRGRSRLHHKWSEATNGSRSFLHRVQNEKSRGTAATTPGLHPGNDGSSPSGTILARSQVSYARLDDVSSWSSPECSPPCHGGDRGFKSHRGRSVRLMREQAGALIAGGPVPNGVS